MPLLLAIVGVLVSASPAAAQQMAIDPAFSDEVIGTLGLPEVTIQVGPDGVTAPESLQAGPHLVTLSAPAPWVAYVNVVQPPAGLSDAEAHEQMLAAARDDLAQPGWTYAGGNNTFEPGVPVTFVIDLAPGEYRLAASYYQLEGDQEEVLQLLPLTVTEADAPVARPEASVTLEMTDELRYIVAPESIAAGPQLWEIANSGEHHPHHAVFFRIPDGVTAGEIVDDFTTMMSGTPVDGPPLIARFTHVGYAALQSGGQSTWLEFDFAPGTYAVICFIVDPESGMPHLLNGMVTTFTVD